MSQQLTIAFILFAITTLYTPGPNNIMLMTSGLNFGFRRTLPHAIGVALGFSFLAATIGLGLGAVFKTWPVLQAMLKYAGAAYLIYLAAAIALSPPNVPNPALPRGGVSGDRPIQGETTARPMTFFGAAMFQWVNVKGWVIAVGSFTAYAAIASYPWNIVMLAGLLLAIGLSSSLTWVLLGTWLQAVVTSPGAVRIFNIVMAMLLLASLYPVLMGA